MITALQPLRAEHNFSNFNSGVPSLDHCLKQRELQNQHSGASRTFVVCDAARGTNLKHRTRTSHTNIKLKHHTQTSHP